MTASHQAEQAFQQFHLPSQDIPVDDEEDLNDYNMVFPDQAWEQEDKIFKVTNNSNSQPANSQRETKVS